MDTGGNKAPTIITSGPTDPTTSLLRQPEQDVMNSSFMVGDLDLSRLDARRQAELAAILEDKEKLILEKSLKHKEILDNYDTLKQQFIIKDTEAERLKKAMSDQKTEIVDFRDKMKIQHEEIVGRVKQAEETVRDLSGYITSMTKLAVAVYSLSVKALNESTRGGNVNFVDTLESVLKDLEKSFKPVSEKYAKNPKRLLALLEEVKTAHNFSKDRIQPKMLAEAFENLKAAKEEEKQKKLSMRKESIKRGNAPMAGQAGDSDLDHLLPRLGKDSKETVERLQRTVHKFKDIKSTGTDADRDVFAAVADFFAHANDYLLTNAEKYTDPTPKMTPTQKSGKPPLPVASPGDPEKLKLKIPALTEKLRVFREQFESTISSDNASLQFDYDHFLQENTGLDDQIYELLKQNQEMKEKIASERLTIEFNQKRLADLTSESASLTAQLNDVQLSSSNANLLLTEENNSLIELKNKLFAAKEKLKDSEDEILRIRNRRQEYEKTLKEIEEGQKTAKDKLEYARRDEKIGHTEGFGEKQKLFSSPVVAPKQISETGSPGLQNPQMAPQGTFSDNKTMELITPIKMKTDVSGGEWTDAIHPIATLKQGLGQEGLPAIGNTTTPVDECLQSLSARYSSLCKEMSNFGKSLNQSNALEAELQSLEVQIKATTEAIQKLNLRNEELAGEARQKRQVLLSLQREEQESKQKYIKEELKMESDRFRTVQLQGEIAKIQNRTEEVKREGEYKKKDLIAKQDQLAKYTSKLNNMTSDNKKLDEELAQTSRKVAEGYDKLSEPLLSDQSPVKGTELLSHEVTYAKLVLSAAIPLLIGYLLIKIGIL